MHEYKQVIAPVIDKLAKLKSLEQWFPTRETKPDFMGVEQRLAEKLL